MPRFSWSEESISQLKALIAEKHTAGRIAAILSALLKARITRNAVIGKCHRDGIALAQTRQGRPRNRDGTPPARRPRVLRVQFGRCLSPSIPEPAAMPVEPLKIPLIDLEQHHCREVVSSDGAMGLFCGHPKQAGSSFCRFHHAINWMPITPKKPAVFRFGGRAA